MEFLVTGGTGFIGSHLVEELVKRGRVTVITNEDDWLYIPEHCQDRCELKVVEIDDRCIFDDLGRFDLVYHLAAIAHPGEAEGIPDIVRRVNIEGTRNICEFVAEKGGHLVFTSTGYVYGEIKYSPMDEEHPLEPGNVYGKSKLEAERVIQGYMEDKGIEATILRLFNMYGPRQREDYIVPTVITKVLRGEEVRLGNPEPIRGFTYIKDLIRCFLMISENKNSIGKVWNIGNDEGFRIKELVGMILDIAGSDIEPIYDPKLFRKNEVMEMLVDYSRIREDIGWGPTTSLEDGLRESIDFYRSCMD